MGWSRHHRDVVVEAYFKNNESIAKTQTAFRKYFDLDGDDAVPNRKTILLWTLGLRQTGSEPKKKPPEHPKNVKTPERNAEEQDSIEKLPSRSTRKHDVDFGISDRSPGRIFNDDVLQKEEEIHMENVVVISPPPVTNGSNTESNVSDDDSESIILDLHVSDDSKDTLQEVSEEDILNKYIADDDEEMIGNKLIDRASTDEVEEKESRDVKNGTDLNNINNQEKIKTKKTGAGDDDHHNTKSTKSIKLGLENEKTIDDNTINCQLNENEEDKTENNIDDDKSKNDAETTTNNSSENKKVDDENQEDGDLLQVMETSFVDEQEKDDASSSSEKEENGKDDDNIRKDDEEITDETNSNNEEINSNNEETNSNNEEMNTNNEEMNSNNEEINSNNEEMNSNNEEMNSNNEEMNSNNEEMNSNSEEMNSNSEEISSNNEEISSNIDDINSNNEESNTSNKEMIRNKKNLRNKKERTRNNKENIRTNKEKNKKVEKPEDVSKNTETIDENSNQESKDVDNELEKTSEINQINGDLDQNQENIENQIDKDIDGDQNDECAMDIEENNVGGVIILDGSDEMRAKLMKGYEGDSKNVESDSDKAIKSDDSKDNLGESDNVNATNKTFEFAATDDDKNDIKSVLFNENVKSDNTELKKITKRQLPDDFETEQDEAKKMKLDQNAIKKKSETVKLKALNSFKAYMKDEALKNMTRAQLEEFCLQKTCECLVDKSELADLRQKIRTLEQTIEQYRRESVTIANQTRDLKIVHEKVTAALKVAKEQKSKPLVPVKITRSVGLQAVLDQHNRQTRINGVIQNGKNINCNNNNINNVNNVQNVNKNNNNVTSTVTNNNLNNIRSPGKTQQSVIQSTRLTNLQHRSPSQPTGNVKQTILNKQLAQKENRQTTLIQAQVNGKKPADTAKAVIDLTDEDEKISNSPNKTVRTNGQATKNASLVTTQTGTKVMVIPSTVLTRPVMLKVNPNVISKTTNITIPTSQVSVVTQSPTTQIATTQSVVTKLTPIRPATTPQPTNPQTTRSPVQRVRQSSSPLPPPPPDQHHPGRMVPPKPHLNLTKSPCGTGIVLQWKMPYQLSMFDAIVSYQLYAYQVPKANQKTDGWGKIGDVKALELPMAVTLTQFAVGYRYYFAVRAVDSHQRVGLFSEPQTITL
ncbi:putative uncharacterized protein DDB_G0289263 isoform X1 [Onthophagus taurus]|uniref:putative uncharacterized protein DDB_G0289263 isoform X1 n=2 Tax=Onthophagus taurus TaxID=166361 RepID=UPI0039BDC633